MAIEDVTTRLRNPEAAQTVIAILQQRFADKVQTGEAFRAQHAHTTTYLPAQLPDAERRAQAARARGRRATEAPGARHPRGGVEAPAQLGRQAQAGTPQVLREPPVRPGARPRQTVRCGPTPRRDGGRDSRSPDAGGHCRPGPCRHRCCAHRRSRPDSPPGGPVRRRSPAEHPFARSARTCVSPHSSRW